MPTIIKLASGGTLLICSLLIFRKVGADYGKYGMLSKTAAFLETMIFLLHGVTSYAFLNSKLSAIRTEHWTFIMAIALMAVGLLGVLANMAQLGWGKTVGQHVDGLHTSGMYRLTRNPQILIYSFVVTGYSLLWPSWSGLVWVGLYATIAHLMVRTEEAHLIEQYCDEYSDYCRKTARYIGFPRREPR